ncbi:MAG: DUF3040 domain-containing protein [Leucobacter sp.]
MGLSEREQQLLDDMERRLYQSEADVMQTASGAKRRPNLRAVVLGILLGLLGVGVLIAGVAAQQLWLGLIGFAAMLGGAVLASTKGKVESGEIPTEARARQQESFGDRMNRRWNERLDGDR